MPRYCQRCVLPDTRPGVALDANGVCNGCRNAEAKRSLDWGARAGAFEAIAAAAKRTTRSYDCVIPVSGGKDSFWQVLTCLEHGLHPLCASYVPPGRTALGERNLRALGRLGVDVVELRLNPRVERAFIAKAFRKTAISGLVAHMAIYRWPVQLALAHGIPLVVYGENSAFEYGSVDPSLAGAHVDERWLATFGVTAGTTAEDWIDAELSAKDLAPLLAPRAADLAGRELAVVFLGWYFAWDPERSRQLAMAHGFAARAEGARVGHYDFVNIDDDMIGVHHHPKWHKFGITRSWDTLSMEIRAGRMTRAQAIAALHARGDETPWADIDGFCSYLGLARAEYFAIVESFRDQRLWSRRGGRWVIEDFLVPDFPWPEDVEARAT